MADAHPSRVQQRGGDVGLRGPGAGRGADVIARSLPSLDQAVGLQKIIRLQGRCNADVFLFRQFADRRERVAGSVNAAFDPVGRLGGQLAVFSPL